MLKNLVHSQDFFHVFSGDKRIIPTLLAHHLPLSC